VSCEEAVRRQLWETNSCWLSHPGYDILLCQLVLNFLLL
jgi:hypothetical protein